MYIVDLENNIIHDMSFIRYECRVNKIPDDKKKKVYSLNTVKTMLNTDQKPHYNGCQYCMADYHLVDFTKIFQ
ncbi:hypothetical protein HQ587_11060 [bacterium]|nr:hypothetical protein [bacterium]